MKSTKVTVGHSNSLLLSGNEQGERVDVGLSLVPDRRTVSSTTNWLHKLRVEFAVKVGITAGYRGTYGVEVVAALRGDKARRD
ncbi:hypothetical protein J6590_029070 [Homalodisca vitripennis]|nr:hypothetical protein J6590_029070 [Homalodisca vitripennis]